MVENEGVVMDEQAPGIPTGAIVASAVAAGVVAYMIRRAKREPKIESPADVAAAAWERVHDPRFRARTAGATKDFLFDRVGHELKPVLLEVLDDVKEYVDQGFKRAERAIREF
jgi:hypothetical protein